MDLRTTLTIPPIERPLRHQDACLFIGSCFAEHMGDRLKYLHFDTLVNPFGTLFNPVSMAKLIRMTVFDQKMNQDDFLLRDDRYLCYDLHSKLWAGSREAFAQEIEQLLSGVRAHIKRCKHVFITLGSSFVFRLKENGSIVANCHKQPSSLFERQLLSVEDIRLALDNMISDIRLLSEDVQIVFQVSPVRHIRDGLIDNNRSKARLIEALHYFVEREEVLYFPSYEWIMDDLRDYRFYAQDLVHPNELAQSYVWENFSTIFFDTNTIALNERIERIYKGLRHKPFHSESKSYRQFVEKLHQQIKELEAEHPFIQWHDQTSTIDENLEYS